MRYLPMEYELPTAEEFPELEDDGIAFFQGLAFALLFEAIGAVIVLALWWFAWAALP